MGSGTDQIREELEQTRDDAAERINELQNRLESVTEQATSTVENAKEQIKEKLDLKQQISNNPLVAVGAGLVVGFLLAGAGEDGGSSRRSRSGGGMSNDLIRQLRETARSTGLEDTLTAASGALMSTLSERMKSGLPSGSSASR